MTAARSTKEPFVSQPNAHVEPVSIISDTSVAAGTPHAAAVAHTSTSTGPAVAALSQPTQEGGRMARTNRRKPTEADIAPVLAVLAAGREYAQARALAEHAKFVARQCQGVAA